MRLVSDGWKNNPTAEFGGCRSGRLGAKGGCDCKKRKNGEQTPWPQEWKMEDQNLYPAPRPMMSLTAVGAVT